jgi:hypothetical protein
MAIINLLAIFIIIVVIMRILPAAAYDNKKGDMTFWIVAFALVNLLDIGFTYWGLSIGVGTEGNPIIGYVIYKFGVLVGLFGPKLIFIPFWLWFQIRAKRIVAVRVTTFVLFIVGPLPWAVSIGIYLMR